MYNKHMVAKMPVYELLYTKNPPVLSDRGTERWSLFLLFPVSQDALFGLALLFHLLLLGLASLCLVAQHPAIQLIHQPDSHISQFMSFFSITAA